MHIRFWDHGLQQPVWLSQKCTGQFQEHHAVFQASPLYTSSKTPPFHSVYFYLSSAPFSFKDLHSPHLELHHKTPTRLLLVLCSGGPSFNLQYLQLKGTTFLYLRPWRATPHQAGGPISQNLRQLYILCVKCSKWQWRIKINFFKKNPFTLPQVSLSERWPAHWWVWHLDPCQALEKCLLA